MIRAVGFLHLSDETKALRMHSFEVTVARSVVAQRFAQSGDGLADCRFADHRVAPHGIHQLFARYEPVTVGNEVDKEIEHDRLEMNLLPIPGEPPRIRIDLEVIETVHRVLAHGLPVPSTR